MKRPSTKPLFLAVPILAGLSVWSGSPGPAQPALPQTVEFNRDIRPILSDTCFHCHGPDQAKRKANLRFDTEEGAKADLGGYFAVVSGKPAESELIQRVTAKDDSRMPPPKSARVLSERQIELLRRWIGQGAKWEKHWAFIPPRRLEVPRNPKGRFQPRNPIDNFVFARLEREGLSPSPEADRTTLVRRVTLDLTGLPPTIDEIERALSDESANWYEKVVDRLLSSPRYGERMASRWLDAARYADTNGYQTDGERVMWRWRDWVIDAFNADKPFDQFTIEQIAGDLLPNATLEQKIATGFNRNHRGNSEGGIIPEEYAVEYVADRVETTATVWLGLTLTCSRCHDHKYDPVSQKEFYQLFAYFNNVPEHGRAIKYGNSPPFIKAPTREQQAQLKELETKRAEAEKRFAKLAPELAAAQAAWEKSLKADVPVDWSIATKLVAHYPLDGDTRETSGGRLSVRTAPDVAGGNTEASGRRPPATASGDPIRPAELKDGSLAFVPGRVGQALSLDGKRYLDAGNVADFGFYDRFTFAACIHPVGDKGGTILSRMTDGQRGADGYRLHLEKGKLQLNLVKRWLDDALHVESERALEPGRWHHVLVTYDGSRVAAGVRFYVNGKPEKLKVLLDELNQSFDTKEPLRIGSSGGSEGRFHGLIDDVRVWAAALTAEEAEIVAVTDSITAIASVPPDKRTESQSRKLGRCFLEQHAPRPIQEARQQVLSLHKESEQLVDGFPTCMVMEEMPKPRDTHLLIRGVYDRRGDKVGPGVPAVLQPLPKGVPNNRLALARWLVDPANPLTARVTVNRFWQMYFGTGLVKTVEDFGVQGEWPSHPELLDWLASEFAGIADSRLPIADSPNNPQSAIRNPQSRPWSMKALQRLIVTSATYRQSSRVTPELLQRDPENRLLARGPRGRLPAETVRDQALFISGLFVEKRGGPSVKPYQPAGLVKELTGTEDYQQDHGENLYRRSLYTFWKRTVAPPMMLAFDAAGRETCVVRETRTNTPLQALNLMNDVAYVEASRHLAQRLIKEGGKTPEKRLTFGFRLATARRPTALEMQILRAGLDRSLARYQKDRDAALKLVSVGESKRDEKLDVSELAAYTATAGLILNLDEVITKE